MAEYYLNPRKQKINPKQQQFQHYIQEQKGYNHQKQIQQPNHQPFQPPQQLKAQVTRNK